MLKPIYIYKVYLIKILYKIGDTLCDTENITYISFWNKVHEKGLH